MLTRRSMLGLTGSLMAGAMLRPMLAAAPAPKAPEFSLFTKHLVGLPYDQLAETVAELGFKGVEAPVRKGGHVEPARVEEDLPKLVEAFRKCGVTITLLTSDLNEVNEADRTEKVLRAARALGIPRYRMKWYPYSGKKSLWTELDEIRPRLKDLVSLSKQVGILPCYQNHSGPKNVGAAIWDMATLMRDYRADELSWNFDFFHAMVEGGLSWPNHLALARDHISMVYFKNFKWQGRLAEGCPLAEGNVGKDSVALLRKSGYAGPVCLHVEYLKGRVTDAGALKVALDATRKDFATLKEWWA
ncbi:MAG: sugar phosphate isomerase/epimerase family protein [Opitutales bacterium]|jgi:sugar phosphate isomerase/epimerase